MDEVPFFFPGGSGRLFGVIHHPRRRPASGGFVFCHAFGEEKLWAHRPWVRFARELAVRGHAVLRFDYRGNGDSDGEFRESSVATAVADVGRAAETLKELAGLERVSLLGLRLGSNIAALAAEARGDVDELVLWEPILSGARYVQELLMINVATQMAVYKEVRVKRTGLVEKLQGGGTANVDGYEMSRQMYEQIAGLAPAGSPKGFGGRCLVVQIARNVGAPPPDELERLASSFPAGALERVQEEPFWKEIAPFYEHAPNLFPRTLAWVERRGA